MVGSDMPKTLGMSGVLADLPAGKRAVVEEFTEVIRKHGGQSSTSLARLACLAFSITLGIRETRQDKFALAVARGMEARQKLAEAEGGSLSSEEVARLLQISKTAVLKRLEAGRLLAWREERLRAARFPRWQFDEHGQVLAGLTDVLDCLHQDQGLDAWGKILFFLQAKTRLAGKRPLDLLREGRVKQVCQAAQAYAE
jgi:hypothetical protein